MPSGSRRAASRKVTAPVSTIITPDAHFAASSVIAHRMALEIHAVMKDARDQHALLVRHIKYYVGLVFLTPKARPKLRSAALRSAALRPRRGYSASI